MPTNDEYPGISTCSPPMRGQAAETALLPAAPPVPRGHVWVNRFYRRLVRVLSRAVTAHHAPALPEVVSVPLPVRDLPPALDHFTLLQISDIHCGPTYPVRRVGEMVDQAQALRCDAVVLTGDYQDYDPDYIPACAAELGRLHAPAGVYAVLGNHDYYDDPVRIRRELTRVGITVLVNESRQLAERFGGLWLAGIDDISRGAPDLTRTLQGIPAGAPAVLLAHEPDIADETAATGRFLAQLSGHSHGGQVRLPRVGAVKLPRLAHKYPIGLRRVGEMWLYTSRGVGFSIPIRVNCPAEITRFQFIPLSPETGTVI